MSLTAALPKTPSPSGPMVAFHADTETLADSYRFLVTSYMLCFIVTPTASPTHRWFDNRRTRLTLLHQVSQKHLRQLGSRPDLQSTYSVEISHPRWSKEALFSSVRYVQGTKYCVLGRPAPKVSFSAPTSSLLFLSRVPSSFLFPFLNCCAVLLFVSFFRDIILLLIHSERSCWTRPNTTLTPIFKFAILYSRLNIQFSGNRVAFHPSTTRYHLRETHPQRRKHHAHKDPHFIIDLPHRTHATYQHLFSPPLPPSDHHLTARR